MKYPAAKCERYNGEGFRVEIYKSRWARLLGNYTMYAFGATRSSALKEAWHLYARGATNDGVSWSEMPDGNASAVPTDTTFDWVAELTRQEREGIDPGIFPAVDEEAQAHDWDTPHGQEISERARKISAGLTNGPPTVERLAAIIRRVDGNHDKGAAELAELIIEELSKQ